MSQMKRSLHWLLADSQPGPRGVRLSPDGAGPELPGKGACEAWQVTGKLVQGRVLNARPRF